MKVSCRPKAHVLTCLPETQLGKGLTNLVRNNSAANNTIRTSESRLTNMLQCGSISDCMKAIGLGKEKFVSNICNHPNTSLLTDKFNDSCKNWRVSFFQSCNELLIKKGLDNESVDN